MQSDIIGVRTFVSSAARGGWGGVGVGGVGLLLNVPSRSGTEDGRRGGGRSVETDCDIGRSVVMVVAGVGPVRRDAICRYTTTRGKQRWGGGVQCPDAIGVIYPEGGAMGG